ncbi:hypothetical protein LEM8419_00178 [Neolewinella maritima]|uniref:PKD/Chitinase domain-containing protein n=1 Tax=Neolewinella maritima TaxID=1383882 RepID=A0ABM9AWT1_9BACT|nr:PKD domain-containing protein [Neolewinella maritima]CAH0998863.1 hypothetical protein LEM8419_00178 [Neolewinella maritima]
MNFSHGLYILFFFLLISSCEDEVFLPALDEAALPSDLSLAFTVAPDNSGTVTILPQGQAVTSFTIDYGDGTSMPETVAPGETASHVYGEGTYTVTLEAMNINGQTTSITQELTLSFRAPENLNVSVVPTPGNPLSIDVSATADQETNFLVTFGEDPEAEPVSFQEGEVVSYTYGSTGTYELIVRALSGGAASVADTVTVNIDNPLFLPLTFEDPTKDYNFQAFGGASVEVVDNPDATGLNTTARVARLTKAENAETFAGALIEVGQPLDFSSVQQLRMLVYSPDADIPVLLKLENASDPDVFAEVTANTTVAGAWEELVFDFSGADLTQEFTKVVVFFDFGTPGAGKDYYFDELSLQASGPELALPLTFESSELTYEWFGFGGATAGVIDNPVAGGSNSSARVVTINKASGAETFAGAVLELPRPLDFTGGGALSMQVWSPRAGVPVLLKLENATDPNTFVEVTVSTTVASSWETLTFDFSSGDLSREYSKLAVFFDFGAAGVGEDFYFDDIRYAGEEDTPLGLPLTFEEAAATYTFTAFGGAEAMVVANPDLSGINTSAQVATINKADGAQVFAGAFVELPTPIDFGGRTTFRMKVWSPVANIPVLFKLENATDADINVEVTATTTVASQWQELTFDLAAGDLSQSYSKVVVFFDFGAAGTDTDYYFDDIRLE